MTPTLSAVLGLWQDRDPLEALETARLADELGYGELWIGEMATFDAFALAAAIGARTQRIVLTVGPLAAAVRDPMAMAMGVASVSALCGGRSVNLAIGASSPVVVERWHGREYARPAARLGETADALRSLLAGEKSAYEGELVRSQGYRLRLPAPPGASLTVAAFGDRAVNVAARAADRMVINLCTPALAAQLCERLNARAAEAGMPVPPLAAWVVACVDPDEEALRQLTMAVVGYLAAPGYAEMFTAAGFGELVDFARTRPAPRELLAEVPPELPRAVGLVGDIDTVRARLGEYAAAGVDEIALVAATAGDPGGKRTLRALASTS